jgi:hypothetical protein
MKNRNLLGLSILALTVAACSPAGKSATSLAQQGVENLGCKTSQSETWSTLHRIAETEGQYPSAEEVRTALLKAGQDKGLEGSAYENYVEAFVANYSAIIEGIKKNFAPADLAGWNKALAEMEIGARVTEVHAKLQDEIKAKQQKLDEAEHLLGKTCANPDAGQVTLPLPPPPDPTATVWDQLKSTVTPEVYGARRTLATAYQSCDVLKLAPVNAATPNVQGITITGTHPAGGRMRQISSVSNVASTHYYIKGMKQPRTSCFKVSGSPLIYDFGGKPYVSSSNEKLLDFFKNGGSGTSVLGIDCSAFVFSSLAVAGLKLDPDPKKPLKASLVSGVGSSMFKEPQSNGLRCLDKISVSKSISILPGDIIAINGHVVMIDAIGADPFGLNKITQSSDCTSAKLPYTSFDFTIAQSAPVKEGMGINRYSAKDYLATSNTFRTGVTNYAVAACKAKFGVSSTVSTTSLAIVRHRKTADCMTAPLQENKEDCITSCKAI